MKYEDALIEANNYAMVLSPGESILADTDWWYVKPFFQLLPEALAKRGMAMRSYAKGWFIERF